MKRRNFVLGRRLTILILVLLMIIGTSFAQGVEVPGSNKELNGNTSISIDAVPELSLTDNPAVWNQGYTIACGKANSCSKKAKRFAKKERFIDALGYAAKTFKYKPRKRAEKRALQVLTNENYARAQKEFEKNLRDNPDIPEYIDWTSTKGMFYRMWFANRFNVVNGMLQQMVHPKVKITVNPVDHHMLGKLAGTLSSYRKYSANDYYQGGVYFLKHANGDKQQLKRAAMSFLISDYYVTNFKDAKTQYESAKEKATSSVSIAPAKQNISYSISVSLDEEISSIILNMRGFKQLPFVELSANSQSDYIVRMVIDEIEHNALGASKNKEEFSGVIKDENGNEITKTATLITNEKANITRCKITYNVIERKSKKQLYGGVVREEYRWSTIWSNYSGELSVIPRKKRKYIDRKPDRSPTKKVLFQRVVSMCAPSIAHNLYNNFIRNIGAAPIN